MELTTVAVVPLRLTSSIYRIRLSGSESYHPKMLFAPAFLVFPAQNGPHDGEQIGGLADGYFLAFRELYGCFRLGEVFLKFQAGSCGCRFEHDGFVIAHGGNTFDIATIVATRWEGGPYGVAIPDKKETGQPEGCPHGPP